MSHHNNNVGCFNYTNAFNNNIWYNYTLGDEKSEILAWLSLLEPRIRHQGIQTRRVEGVGDWLFQTQEYRNWFDGACRGESDNSALFCYGGPGVGKTYISSIMIDTLCKEAMGQNTVVAGFYFDFAAQEEQSPAAVLGSVLRQAVGGLDGIPEGIVKAFRDRGNAIGGQRLVLSEIVEFLQDITSSRSTFICIDALDECPIEHRVKLLDSLKSILQKSPGARIFLTGRTHIRDEVEMYLAGRAVTRSITPTRGDIITFLLAKLEADSMPGAMDSRLAEEIIKNIPEIVSEIFLLVSLSIETILQETTIYRRRQKLWAMKDGLDLGSAYEATLGRIKAREGDRARLGIAALMWISHSGRPLQVDELCHALAIEIGSTDLNNDNIPAISTLISCCQGLVTVDKGASTVRLIHFTLQDYLCTHPGLFGRAHSTMAEVCLTYLNFQSIKELSSGQPPNIRDIPFLEYSSLYWGTHARVELSDPAKTLALKLLDQFDNHISSILLWNSVTRGWLPDPTSGREPFSALHCISYFGVAEVANVLIRMKRWDVNQIDDAGMTPLIWAARNGHEEVVRLLLQEKLIHPDQHDAHYWRTPLSWAAGNGRSGVVKLFLGPGFVNPGSIARQCDIMPVVIGLVFGAGYVNPDSSDVYGRTPLSWAAGSGHEEIVKLLLGRKDVEPDTPSVSGQTPLSRAAENGHEEIVKLLLGRDDVNPNSLSSAGRPPLTWAALNGHEGVVKLLLQREDVNPDIPDTKFSETPLLLAAVHGREGIVKLLLGRGDVNPDSSDKHGRTPLAWAAARGHKGVVRLLLEREDVDPNKSNRQGLTPLSWAIENGHDGVVKLLGALKVTKSNVL